MESLDSSFRDPSGYIFKLDGKFYRAIHSSYKDNLHLFETSGLLSELLSKGQVLSYETLKPSDFNLTKDYFSVIFPDQLKHISYPNEWCFSQYKDAALLTLEIQETSLKYGMSLKDSSAFNIQFHNGKAVMIDTLSFERYEEGEPWIGYQQFCQHFLAPLLLASFVDIRSLKLIQMHMDGIPLDYVVKQLSILKLLKPMVFIHIYLHSKAQNKNSSKIDSIKKNITKSSLLGLIGSLKSLVNSLKWNPKGTEWGDYYAHTNYSDLSMSNKRSIIDSLLDEIKPKTLWDVGGNNGEFTRLASIKGVESVLFDIDYAAIEKSYLKTKIEGEANITSFVMDFTNPSPGIGWNNKERLSIIDRGPADVVFALALIHHLCISNNLPFHYVADFFSRIVSKSLVIEFVPKSDSQVQRLLRTREDIFTHYDQEFFEKEFVKFFDIAKSIKVSNSKRFLYLMHKRNS
jgi:ribosomal protein L11 methylase PrmA